MPESKESEKTNYRIDVLQTKVEANMETLKASMDALQARNEASNERLRADMESLRTDMEKNLSAMRKRSDDNTAKIMIAMGIAVAVIGVLIRLL